MDKTSMECFYVLMLSLMHHTINARVSEIFNLYTELHDIRISLFSPEGELVYPDRVGRPNCSYCSMLRGALGLDSSCRALDRQMMQVSLERQDMVTYTCHAGMREAAAPIVVEGQLVGFVMLGQFRSEAAAQESPYREQWEGARGNDELQKEYEKTAIFPEHKIETLLSMFQHLLEFIVESQLIQHKDYDLIEPLIRQMKAHPERSFSLAEASQMIGRSPSTVTRIFKKITGCGFKQYQTETRLERAARMLKTHANAPVMEVARTVGYDDGLYFSRVFARQYGCSPTDFRQRSE